MGLRGVIAGMLALWLIAAVPWQADQDGQGLVLTNLGKAWIGTATVVRIEGAATGQFLGPSATNALATTSFVNAAKAPLATTAFVNSAVAPLTGPTNAFVDIDTLTAQATTGTVSYYNPGSGDIFDYSAATVWPIYSNAVGRAFGAEMSDNLGVALDYHGWAWPAQPGAVGYFVMLEAQLYSPPQQTFWYTNVGANVTNLAVPLANGGSDIASKPSTVAMTNEIRSTWLPTYVGSQGTNALLGATASLTNGLGWFLASTNRTAYADPQFPLWSPPFFGNIQSALTWLGSASFADGTVSNHGVLKISGQWSVSGNRIQISSDKYDWIEIDASGAVVDCNVASVGNEYGWLDFNTGVDRVRITGGRWRAWQDSNNNGQLIKIRGPYASLQDMDVWTSGSNWNQTCGIRVDGAFATADRIRASIASGPKGSGGYTPVQINGSSCLVQRSSWDMWEKPNSFLGHASGNGRQFVNCTFRGYNYSQNYPFFFNVGEGDRWENCTFANVVNSTFATNAPWPVIGRTSETARNFYVNNCIFNQIDWYTNHVPAITNNIMISTNYPGIVVPKME